MPYDPNEGVYEFIDEQIAFPQRQTTHRPKQLLPRRDILEAKRLAEIEARQLNLHSYQTVHSNGLPRVRNAPRQGQREDDEIERPPRSAIRFSPNSRADVANVPDVQTVRHVYNEPFVKRKSRVQGQPLGTGYRQEIYTEEIDEQETERPAPRPKRGVSRRFHFHPLVWLGLGMIVMFLAWVGLSNLVAYAQQTLNDWHYLRPRVFQTTAVVGASDSPSNPTYFEALNLNRHVYIFECPGGDCTKARIINGPTLFGDGQDLSPITITFKDVKGDGKLDMIVHVEDQIFVLMNDGAGNFRPLKAGERIHL